MASNKTRLTKLQVIELFTFKPRRLGKQQNPNVECAQANFKELVLWDLKFLQGCLKQKKWVSRAYHGSMWAKGICGKIKHIFLTKEQKIIWKC